MELDINVEWVWKTDKQTWSQCEQNQITKYYIRIVKVIFYTTKMGFHKVRIKQKIFFNVKKQNGEDVL